MAPALAPALIGQEAAACALLGLVLGSVRAAVYSTVSMRPVSFTSPLSRSRLVTLSCAPASCSTPRAVSMAALSALHCSTRLTPVTVSFSRFSRMRSWGGTGVFSVVLFMA